MTAVCGKRSGESITCEVRPYGADLAVAGGDAASVGLAQEVDARLRVPDEGEEDPCAGFVDHPGREGEGALDRQEGLRVADLCVRPRICDLLVCELDGCRLDGDPFPFGVTPMGRV